MQNSPILFHRADTRLLERSRSPLVDNNLRVHNRHRFRIQRLAHRWIRSHMSNYHGILFRRVDTAAPDHCRHPHGPRLEHWDGFVGDIGHRAVVLGRDITR